MSRSEVLKKIESARNNVGDVEEAEKGVSDELQAGDEAPDAWKGGVAG